MSDFEYTSLNDLRSLLAGLIVEFPTKYPGRGRVLNPGSAEAQTLLSAGVPGVRLLGEDLLIPHNLHALGERPGSLFEYPLDPVTESPLGLKLKDYQRRAVSFLRAVGREEAGAILGGDPGTAKTACALQALWLDGYLQRTGLVVGPLGAKGTWCSANGDPLRYYGLTIKALEGTTVDYNELKTAQWFFIHYDILKAWQSAIFSTLKPASIVIDEIHYTMSSENARWQATFGVAANSSIERRYGLTGTPIPKTRLDLFGQLAIVQPNQWGSKYDYGIRHCGGHRVMPEGTTEGKSYWVFDGRSNSEELRARLAGVYLRYTKADVSNELPGLTRHRIEVELPPEIRKEYQLAKNSILKWQASKGLKKLPEKLSIGGTEVTLDDNAPKALQLVTTSALKSILDKGKLPQALGVLADLMKKHQRIVVFTWKRESAKYLCAELNRTCVQPLILGTSLPHAHCVKAPEIFGPIDGTDPWDKRIEEAEAFSRSPWAIFVATRGSVGIAINNLSCADACLQITPDWNPDGNLQAESRLHREGAWAKEIHSYYMIAPNTLDDRILTLLHQKSTEAKSLVSTDLGGIHLAADLDPTLGDDAWSLDEICNMLAQSIEE